MMGRIVLFVLFCLLFFPEICTLTWCLLHLCDKRDKQEGKLQTWFRKELDTVDILTCCSYSRVPSMNLKSPAKLSALEFCLQALRKGVACYEKKSEDQRSEHVCKVHDEFSE